MAIEGALRDVGLADICQLLAMGRKTGCLTLTDRSNFGYIYFRDGRVIHASVLNRPDRLGDLLVQNGVVSRAELAKAMEVQSQDRGARLGEILVSAGALSTKDLHRFVSLQIEEAVYHLFTWSQGSFHFDPGQEPDEEDPFLVDMPVENLLLEGARRVDEWSLIEKKIPSLELVFEVAEEIEGGEAPMDLTPHQRRILPLVDGERSVDGLVAASGLVEFEVAKALFGLIQAGFVQQAGRRSEVAESAPEDLQVRERLRLGLALYRSGMFQDAAREFQAALERDPRNPSALFRLGLVAFRGRRYDEAAEMWKQVPSGGSLEFFALRNRALAVEALGLFDQALALLEQAEALRPGDPGIRLARGVLLLRTGEPESARAELTAYRNHPRVETASEVFYAYAILAAGMSGDPQAAVALGREGLARYPDSGPVLVNTGAVLEWRGDVEGAEALYSRASSGPRPMAQAFKALGDLEFGRGHRDLARARYERAATLAPRLGDDLYLRLGELAERDGDMDAAVLFWRRALALNPENAEVRERLAALERAG